MSRATIAFTKDEKNECIITILCLSIVAHNFKKMPSNKMFTSNQIKFLLFHFLLFLVLPSIAQNTHFNAKTGNLFYQQLNPTTDKVASYNFESWLKTKNQLSSNTSLQILQSEKDELGFTHQRYQVLQSGVPIEGAIIISHTNEKNIITAYNGSLFNIPNIPTQAKITPKEALQKAIEHVGAQIYRWEIEAENEHLKHLTQNQQKSYLPIPELVIAPKNLNFKTQDFRLTYKIDLYALQPLQRLWIYIDAQTGEVTATQNRLCTTHTSSSTVDKVSNRCQSSFKKNLSISSSQCSKLNPSSLNLCFFDSTVNKVSNRCQSSFKKNLSDSASQRSKLSPTSPNLCFFDSTVAKVSNRCQSFSKNSAIQQSNNITIQPFDNLTIVEDTQATAVTKYSGIQTITTDQQNDTYLLQEQGRNIITYNMHQANLFADATVFEDEDNYWDNFNEEQDEVATDVHWATEKTYDYYLEKHGRKSFDGKGITIRSYVHYLNPIFGDVYPNAFWDGEHLAYGDGDNERRSSMTSLDICAHEFTHAVTDYTANLINGGESGALNESFSDIIAIAVEHYAKSETANFLLGDEVALDGAGAIRSAISPKTLEDPDTYNGEYWSLNQTHNRSNVQTHWFYLLVNGGEGINDLDNTYQVEGIGLEAATAIAYRNLTIYLTPPATYQDARFFSIRAAMDLYGDCSFEAQQVAKAWYAVGLGETDGLKAMANFAADETEFCSDKVTVQFANHSIWANSYEWDFGDGNTSSEDSPTHTFEGFDNYTIRLIATSCNGQKDTLIRENWIKMEEESVYCNVVPFNPEEQKILHDCKGVLYDDGGKMGDYAKDKESQITIEVAEADYITLDFRQFDASNNHEMYIYDGIDDNAPLIGVYWGSRLPNDGESITSTGNAVHLRFNSYGGEERTFPGFEAVWECHQTNRNPFISSIDFNDAFTCQGEVSFTQYTLYQPTQWYWDFGDGETSTKQSPSHIYQKNGVFDVQLIACNTFGCDTLTEKAFIKIDQEALECHEARVPKTGKKRMEDCQGMLYDSGGPFGYYSDNTNGILVVEPPATERLGFVINKFNTEAKDDVLLIYDGTTVDAPLLLNESGISFPKDTIWAESGAITLHFRSSPEINNRGFEIRYFSIPKEETPVAAFSWLPANSPLQVPISFKNQSIAANQWHWDFGDETISRAENATHLFTESGEVNVTLTAKNCYTADTLQKQINIQPQPTLQVSPENFDVTLMAGTSTTQAANLSNIGAGDMYFGTSTKAFERDTTVEKFYTDLSSDTYLFEKVRPLDKFRLEVSINGDFDGVSEFLWLRIEDEEFLTIGINSESAANGTTITSQFPFNVGSTKVANWLADQKLKVEIGKSNQVGLEEGGNNYYQIRLVTDHDDWLKTAKNGVVEGETNQELEIVFDASNLWGGTYTNELQILTNESANPQKTIPCTLTVLAHPVAFFEQIGNVSCEGSVTFRDKSINEPDSWEWDFGDGTTSIEQNPTHVFTAKGDYVVSLKVCKNGACDEVTQNIFIAPTADFNFSSDDVPLNREVVFTNLSRGGTSYLWDFGDGTTATEKHPKHIFDMTGTYEVQLIAQTCFQSDTTTRTIHIQAASEATIPVEPLSITLNAGEQILQQVPVRNNGIGDLYYDASLQRNLGKSTKTFDSSGDRTIHIFEGIGEEASDFLQLKVTLNGDFDAANERVWLRLDGEGIQYVLDDNTESTEDETHIITLQPPVYRHLLADGQLLVELENSEEVEPRSDRMNQHSVELIGYGVPWLSLLKQNETVQASETDNLEIIFDASHLNAGIYDFPLQINTNESANNSYIIPTQLEVLGMASMELSTATIDFGMVRVNESISKPFEVFNMGTDTLFVSSMGAQNLAFEVGTVTLVLPPKTSYEGMMTFSPTSIGVFEENFEIQSNVGIQTISLIGAAIGAPKIAVLPDSLFVALAVGEQTERAITVFNTGAYELNFSAQNASFTRFDSLTVQDFHKIADTTLHIFESLQETDSLQLQFNMVGDFNRKNEFADLYINGEWKARLGDLVNDTIYNIQDSLSLAWADIAEGQGFEEGGLEVMLVNSEEVNTGITIAQKHEVRLRTFDDAWIEASQEETTVAIDKTKTMTVNFDASDLEIGTYHQDIEVFADDPVRPYIIVPTTMVVYEKPLANFAADLSEICRGRVQFENLSSENATQWYWDFGDGTTSMEENPTHIYTLPKKYELKLVAGHEFFADTLQFDLVVDFTIADFEAPDTIFNDSDFDLSNNSLGAVNFLWNFGDGNTSDLENPVHQYDTIGVYAIQLITQSANGCLDTLQKSIVVELEVGMEAPKSLPNWIRIYPNPVESDLTIEVHKMFSEGIEAKLFNALGQSVKSVRFEGNRIENRQQIAVNDLPKGVYYLKLEMQAFSGVQKIVIR